MSGMQVRGWSSPKNSSDIPTYGATEKELKKVLKTLLTFIRNYPIIMTDVTGCLRMRYVNRGKRPALFTRR